MCLRWWTPTRSRPGKKTDAESESFSFRGSATLRVVHFGRARCGFKEDRQRAAAVWRLLLLLLHSYSIRTWLADVFGPRVRPRVANLGGDYFGARNMSSAQ